LLSPVSASPPGAPFATWGDGGSWKISFPKPVCKESRTGEIGLP
jgi:hypothetical protein